MEIRIAGIEDLPRAAAEFIKAIGDHKVVAFEAGMGLGKTTLIGEVCRQLGVEDDTSSPTFAIVNEYVAPTTGQVIYHFDCYRLEEREEALDMGVEDYLDSGNLCLIEWPEIIEEFLPADTLRVRIEEEEDSTRIVSF